MVIMLQFLNGSTILVNGFRAGNFVPVVECFISKQEIFLFSFFKLIGDIVTS